MGLWKIKKEEPPVLHGKVQVGRSTKQMIRSLEPQQIVVIHHQDLDEVAAAGLIGAKVKAVINAAQTMSGAYPINGPHLLIEAGIPIYGISPDQFGLFNDGMEIKVDDRFIYASGWDRPIPVTPFTEETWKILTIKAYDNLGSQLNEFIDNTLHYAKKEKDFVIKPLALPELRTTFQRRHVVVVVRGSGYKEDLNAIQDYIADYKPVLIGVDGGADALLEYGYCPDMIVGDMDSISDDALRCGAEIVVHAYRDGRAPGMKRIEELGLRALTLAAPGTSEDIAMLMAFEKDAELIVTLGTHTHMIDFLEKGRKGMASTMLVRMKIGSRLIDAKGVSKLYHRPVKLRKLWAVPLAGFFPLAMFGLVHPGLEHFLDVIWMYAKLVTGTLLQKI
jgi:uncharacterized membrane-anchored protein